MGELKGIYALWYREFKVFQREKSRVIASIISPILWFLVIGGGIGSFVSLNGLNYQAFIFPGVLMQAALFSSVFFGVYIVWDKKIDFLKEVLVAPLSRTSIFIGKILGGATDTLIQIVILLAVGYAFTASGMLIGLNFSLFSVLLSMAILFIAIVGLVSIGLIIGSQMESPEGFQLIMSFLVFPLFFLSGALFPINNLPAWMAPIVFVNPVTYAVDGLRWALLGSSTFPLILDIAVISVFSIIMVGIGTYAFKKMKL
ncbi:MAG: ABC transporter permease [Candidatus Diapherotrites archaeon]|nr:ABC transporter permease [Candidatus Diapherotrites archaeon]